MLNPGRIECVAIALFLALFALIFIGRSGLVILPVPAGVFYYGSWFVTFIFMLRAIGDFKYVGFSERLNATAFAQKETIYYSPLCLLPGISGVLISL